MKKESKHARLDYNQITLYIFIGTNRCCQMHFARQLVKRGIRADLSLEEERIDTPFGVDYFLWLPTKDHTAPALGQFITGVDFLQSLEAQKIKCYVHCKNGHGRAPTLVIAFLLTKGMTREEAVALVKRKRPAMHLNPKHDRGLDVFMQWYKKNKKLT